MAQAFQLAIQIRELRRRSTVKFGKALVSKRLGYCSRNAICQVHFQNKMSKWHQMASNGSIACVARPVLCDSLRGHLHVQGVGALKPYKMDAILGVASVHLLDCYLIAT